MKDTIVIGAGPAGYVTAIRLAQLGQEVVVVEEARVGGVCLNRGCIPVKALLHAAATVRNAAEARQMGINFAPPTIDLISIASWKARIVERLAKGIEFLFKANGVELVRGRGRLVAPDRVVVRGPDGDRELTARNVVIATGSRPAVLSGLEPDHRQIIDSNGALNLVKLPNRVVIVGAGAIGLEFATIFQRFGARVTVLEMCDSILPGTDPELTQILRRQMEREGIEFRLGVKGASCEAITDSGARVCVAEEKGKTDLDADQVLVAIGRVANSGDLGLNELGVEMDERGFVKTDHRYQTNCKGLFAIGDIRGGPLLAHKAMFEGIELAELLTGTQNRKTGRNRAIPSVVYTDPELATVGLSEAAAMEAGFKVRVAKVPVTAIGRSLTLSRSEGLCKVVADDASGKILGVGIVAAQADALIAEAAVAVELGLTAEELGRVVHPHPTMSELVFESAHALLGRAIHIVNR